VPAVLNDRMALQPPARRVLGQLNAVYVTEWVEPLNKLASKYDVTWRMSLSVTALRESTSPPT
jgi:hypothetical protein